MHVSLNAALRSGTAAACLLLTAHAASILITPAQAKALVRNNDQIETVVVTAQKRAQNSQNVPIALTAVAGSELDTQGITGFEQLGERVPSLRFGAGVTGGENVITMRGLGSQNTTPGGDSPVAYSVDGVTLQRSTSVDPEFYDVNRIEVLRGPQGTLYGRNSLGGSINVITNKPTDTLGGAFDVLFGNYAQRTFRGWVNVPLVDGPGLKIYARLTGVSAQHNGYTKNLSTAPGAAHNLDGEDYQMLRGQVYFEFSPRLNLLLSASGSTSGDPAATNTAWWETPTRYMTGPDPIAPGSACDFSTQARFKPRVVCQDYPAHSHNRLFLYAATLNYDMNFATLTSVFGYSTSNVGQTSDGDGSNLPIAFGSAWLMKQRQISEELRLASDSSDSPWTWLFGVYYFWSDNYENFAYSDSGLNDTFPLPGMFDEFNFLSHGYSKSQSFAPFGQIDYDLGRTSLHIPLTVTAGLRYSYDRKYGYNYLDYQLPIACGGSCAIVQGPFAENWGQWTGKGELTYRFNTDVMAYASASRGYLSGGNIIGLAHIYGPESMWSYETGLKSRWYDGRLQVNLAAYSEAIHHLQVFVQSSTESGINNVNGTTNVQGLEMELDAIPVDDLRLNLAATLTDAHYGTYITKDTRFGGPGPGCNVVTLLCNFTGHELNQTPPYTVDVGVEYNFNTSWGTITPRVDTYFSGRVQFLPDNYWTSVQPAYHTTNVTLTWNSMDGRYHIEAFVHNLENDAVISNDGLQSVTLGQQVLEPDNFVYYPPRTFGIRFGVNF